MLINAPARETISPPDVFLRLKHFSYKTFCKKLTIVCTTQTLSVGGTTVLCNFCKINILMPVISCLNSDLFHVISFPLCPNERLFLSLTCCKLQRIRGYTDGSIHPIYLYVPLFLSLSCCKLQKIRGYNDVILRCLYDVIMTLYLSKCSCLSKYCFDCNFNL